MNRKFIGVAVVAMVLVSSGCSAGIFSSKSEEQKEAEKKNQDELKKLYAKLDDLSNNAKETERGYEGTNYPSEKKGNPVPTLNDVVVKIMKIMPKKVTGYNPKDPEKPGKNTNAEKIKNALAFLSNCETLFWANPKKINVWRIVSEAYDSPIKIGTHISNMSIKGSDYEGTREIKKAIKSFLEVVEKVYKTRIA